MLVYTVLVCFKGMVTEKTFKEKRTMKKYYNNNYNWYGEGCIQNTEIYTFSILTIITTSIVTQSTKFQCLNFLYTLFGLVGKV